MPSYPLIPVAFNQCFSIPVLMTHCPACFGCFPPPPHLIQINGSLSGHCRAGWRADHLNLNQQKFLMKFMHIFLCVCSCSIMPVWPPVCWTSSHSNDQPIRWELQPRDDPKSSPVLWFSLLSEFYSNGYNTQYMNTYTVLVYSGQKYTNTMFMYLADAFIQSKLRKGVSLSCQIG